ncbi:MAG: helix-turn-helix domain-containing protein, partial [Xanthomonadales bacterium]|nr:helix-turn-helix domain-containing protein [Xanthomonadales bacterium]
RLYEIANQVGYESDLAFAKAFKRLLGVTPTMYRKKAQRT